jgi:hypothetical protein
VITFLAITAVGATLGLRFKVFVLIPGIAISSITGLAMGIGRGDSIWSSLLATLLAITALQIGYIAGTIVHFGVTGARDRKHQSNIVAGRTKALT